jgi:hypothetical protein
MVRGRPMFDWKIEGRRGIALLVAACAGMAAIGFAIGALIATSRDTVNSTYAQGAIALAWWIATFIFLTLAVIALVIAVFSRKVVRPALDVPVVEHDI